MRKLWLGIVVWFFILFSSQPFSTAQDVDYPPMAVVDADGELWLYGFSNEPQPIPVENARDMVWSPDGNLLAFTSKNRFYTNIMLLNINDMNIIQVNPHPLDYYPNFPLSFSPDGKKIVYADYTGTNYLKEPEDDWATVYSLTLDGVSEEIEYIDYDNASGGLDSYPADSIYWLESDRDGEFVPDQPGIGRFLLVTPFGVLHTQGVQGSGIVKLSVIDNTVNTDIDLPGNPEYVVASPDRTQIVGAVNGQIAKIDLQNLESTLFPTESSPQLLAWNGDNSVFYATRVEREDLLSKLTVSERDMILQKYEYITDVPAYDVQIWRLNLSDGKSTLLYASNAYAIGRLMPSPDGSVLFFSQVPNMENWIEMLLQETKAEDAFGNWAGITPPSLYKLDLIDNSVSLIGTGLYRATINFPMYENNKANRVIPPTAL